MRMLISENSERKAMILGGVDGGVWDGEGGELVWIVAGGDGKLY